MAVVIPARLRRWLRFGMGVGIVAGDHELEILVARARPNGLSVAGTLRVPNYLQRPAAEWGAEVAQMLAGCDASAVPAVVVLPRTKVVARTVALPGVRDEDAGRALELQLESLHPLPAEELQWAWQRIGRGPNFSVAIVERQIIERYSALFSEAGLRLGGFTFSGSALFIAARLGDVAPPAGFMAVQGLRAGLAEGQAEVYAESPSHPLITPCSPCRWTGRWRWPPRRRGWRRAFRAWIGSTFCRPGGRLPMLSISSRRSARGWRWRGRRHWPRRARTWGRR